MKRASLRLLAFFIFAPLVASAQVVTSAVIGAPKTIVTVGEQLQMSALGRDIQGNPVRNAAVAWFSSNVSVVSIDGSGLITARGLGTSNITARVNNVTTAAVIIQTIPMRIDVEADRTRIVIGEQLQVRAKALDIDGTPIPNPPFRWRITSADGNSNAATIDANGLLTASTAGILTVRASINYTVSSLLTPIFEGMLHVTVDIRKEYQLKRVLTNDAIKSRFRLRPSYNSEIAVNESGQIAFVASLEAQSSALVLYEKGRYDVLVSTGTPGTGPQSFTWHMDGPPSLNNRGQVLVRAVMVGSSTSLLLVSREGVAYLAEGFSYGSLQQLNFFRIGRRSLNDRGDIVFLANFVVSGTRIQESGLFLLTAEGRLNLVWSTLDALPDFPRPFFFDNFLFGIDNNANVYFTVQRGSTNAIFRSTAATGPVKVAGAGSVIDGSTIQNVNYAAFSPNGTVAFGVRMTNDFVGIAVSRAARQPELIRLRSYGRVLAVNDSGHVFYIGDSMESNGWGLYRWNTASSELIMSWGTKLESGETFNWARTGHVGSGGEIIAYLETPENPMVVLRPQTREVLFKVGSLIDVEVNRNFFGFLTGAKSGPLHVYSGSGDPGVTEVSVDRVQGVWFPGERPAAGLTGSQLSCGAKAPNGDAYLAISDGIFRVTGNRTETLIRYPMQVNPLQGAAITASFSSCNWNGQNFLAANNAGVFAWQARLDTHSRLLMSDRGQITSLMVLGGPNPTASPSGGVFNNLFGIGGRHSSIALDERNRVMVYASVSGGPSGLFFYENGAWRTAALVNTTEVSGSTILNIQGVRAVNNRFYAMFDLSTGTVIAEYDGQNWSTLISQAQVIEDGRTVRIIVRNFDVNSRGDVAFFALSPSSTVFVRTADGKYHNVYQTLSYTDEGDRLVNFLDLDLRDDGSVYFSGIDTTDRNTAYLALPMF